MPDGLQNEGISGEKESSCRIDYWKSPSMSNTGNPNTPQSPSDENPRKFLKIQKTYHIGQKSSIKSTFSHSNSSLISTKRSTRASSNIRSSSHLSSIIIDEDTCKLSDSGLTSPVDSGERKIRGPSWGSPIIKSKAKRIRLDSSIVNEDSATEMSIFHGTKESVSHIIERPSPLKSKAQRVLVSQEHHHEIVQQTGSPHSTQIESSLISPNRQDTVINKRLAGQLKERISGSPLKVGAKLTGDTDQNVNHQIQRPSTSVKGESSQKSSSKNSREYSTTLPSTNSHSIDENTTPLQNLIIDNHHVDNPDSKEILTSSENPNKPSRTPMVGLHTGPDVDSRMTKVRTKICTASNVKVS